MPFVIFKFKNGTGDKFFMPLTFDLLWCEQDFFFEESQGKLNLKLISGFNY